MSTHHHTHQTQSQHSTTQINSNKDTQPSFLPTSHGPFLASTSTPQKPLPQHLSQIHIRITALLNEPLHSNDTTHPHQPMSSPTLPLPLTHDLRVFQIFPRQP